MLENKLLIEIIEKNLELGINSNFFNIDSGEEKQLDKVYKDAKKISENLNLEHSDRVMVVLPNSIEFIEIMIAVFISGSILSPIPYFLEKQEFRKLIKYVKPSLIITDREDLKEMTGKTVKIKNYKDILNNKLVNKKLYKKINPKLPAALYYSSGTTGNPKGVLYSHNNITNLITSIVREFNFTSADKHLAILPFGHTASINYNILPCLVAGSDLYLTSGFEKIRTSFFATLSKYKITYTQIVPTILFLLNKLNINLETLDLANLKFIGCGSSLLPLTSQNEFIQKYNIKVANLYGLSETGPSHLDNPLDEGWVPGSIGHPLDVNECKISFDGEMMLKGKNIFIGYYNNKKLYDQTVKDGWFYTGDICKYEDNKYWYQERKKDLIIKSGINIQPSEIEEAMYEVEGVVECGVIPVPDETQGDRIIAIIVKNNDIDSELLEKKIKNACKLRLSNYKIPSMIVFWDDLPKTPSKKISRRLIRKKFLNN